ncbi:MAG: BTB/POZ domain-containing protein [Parachlamydia sp.]|nr:BTB/POZ domain-containing protein [Parachlamydia sp.]
MQAPQRAKGPTGNPSPAPAVKSASQKRVLFPPQPQVSSPAKKLKAAPVASPKAAPKAAPLDAASAADLQNQAARLQNLFHHSTPSTNVTFIVQGQRFEAHRKVLSSSACASFFSPLLKQDSPIEIKELSEEAFKALLDHIYVGDLSLNPKTFLELYHFYRARKFDSSAQELETNLLKTVDWKLLSMVLHMADNVVPGSPLFKSLLQLGMQHSALLWIGLDQLPFNLFLEILKKDRLDIESEHHLIKLISCWSKLQVVQNRQRVDACFEHVRFGIMTDNELAHLNDVENLVSPAMWGKIQAKLAKKNEKEAFWQPRLEPSLDPHRFAFSEEKTESKNKEESRIALAQGFLFKQEEREKKLYINMKGSLCEFTFRWEEQKSPQRYPFKLYLDKGGEALDAKNVFIWLQTQVQSNAPVLTVCQLQNLRKGLSFTSRYLATLKSPLEQARIRFSLVVPL